MEHFGAKHESGAFPLFFNGNDSAEGGGDFFRRFDQKEGTKTPYRAFHMTGYGFLEIRILLFEKSGRRFFAGIFSKTAIKETLIKEPLIKSPLHLPVNFPRIKCTQLTENISWILNIITRKTEFW